MANLVQLSFARKIRQARVLHNSATRFGFLPELAAIDEAWAR